MVPCLGSSLFEKNLKNSRNKFARNSTHRNIQYAVAVHSASRCITCGSLGAQQNAPVRHVDNTITFSLCFAEIWNEQLNLSRENLASEPLSWANRPASCMKLQLEHRHETSNHETNLKHKHGETMRNESRVPDIFHCAIGRHPHRASLHQGLTALETRRLHECTGDTGGYRVAVHEWFYKVLQFHNVSHRISHALHIVASVSFEVTVGSPPNRRMNSKGNSNAS